MAALYELAAVALFAVILGMVVGGALRERGARAEALGDAGRVLRGMAVGRLEDGQWEASGALREGAGIVERLDSVGPGARIQRRAGGV